MPYEAEEGDPGEPWLPNCLPWNGLEKNLPLGGWTSVPNFMPVKLVYRWEVADAEEEAGYRTVRAAELTDDDDIIGAIINEALVKKLAETYGPKFAMPRDASTGEFLTRQEWFDRFQTDGIELWALRDKRMGKKVFVIS